MKNSKRTDGKNKATRLTTQSQRSYKKSTQPVGRQPESEPQQESACPYRLGTLYGTLFTEGNRAYMDKPQLIAKVAQLTRKTEKVVRFAYQVLKSKTHRSNQHRSTELTEGGKVKLVAICR